jgi:anthranilate/para-aminobenzoate synthase component I
MLFHPAAARPAVLEGNWLGQDGGPALAAAGPASVLEGGAEALAEFPSWVAWHGRQYPAGAAIGFLSYELARFFETLPLVPTKSLPDLSFAYYPRLEELPRQDLALDKTPVAGPQHAPACFDERSFTQGVRKIREYIVAGDIYQANLTQRVTVRLEGMGPETIYQRLRGGRAPFRAFLKTPRETIISNSPERFFRVSRDRILTSPIKGTIARSRDPLEDRRRMAELLASGKDRAENVMIVDLLRNDLGRICRYESIQTRLWQVDPLPHLFHLVSHVQGTLRPEVGLVEILRALFPCGSVTGAPKIRAMEILAEIEEQPRGISMGAIGIIRGIPGTERFEMDFNVAIRTMTVRDDIAAFNVGGGIVYDSEPRAEFEEMKLKAQPLLEALGVGAPSEPRAIQARALKN